MTPGGRADAEMMRQTYALLFNAGDVTELRAVKKGGGGAVSGYFNKPGALVQAAEELSGRFEGIYVLLNPAKPELLARAANHTGSKHSTSDTDVVARRWLLIDCDPVRASGISSTDAEHTAAVAKAQEVGAWLAQDLWAPEPVLADSGNGAHLLLRIDLPNDAASTILLSRCLMALDLMFSDARVKVDLKTFNAARISKLYGTIASKGDSTDDRPHRLSRLLRVPDTVNVCPSPLLEQLAAMAPVPIQPAALPGDRGLVSFDIDGFLDRHQATLRVVRHGEWNGGRKWALSPCPWNPDHQNAAAYIVQHRSGAIAAGCHHNGCAGNGWPELRAMLEPRRGPLNDRPASPEPEDEPLPAPEAPPLVVPESSLVGIGREFADLHAQYLEAPLAFFYFAFLTYFGACIARKVTLDSELRPEPRLYTVVLGDSADARKTTAIKKADDFFRSLGPPWTPPVLFGVGSAEGIAEELKVNASLLLHFDELKSFVDKAKNETSVALPMVNTLFERNDYDNRTKDKRLSVRGAELSLLAACTGDTYEAIFDRQFQAIGFHNRLWLVSDRSTKRIALPKAIPQAAMNTLRERTIRVLERVDEAWQHNGRRPVPYHLTARALARFETWYLAREGSVFERRLDTYAHRLMILLAATTGADEIDEATVERVVALLGYELEVRRAHDPVDADNAVAVMEEKIRRALARGAMGARELKRACHADRAGIWIWDTSVKNLIKDGEIVEITRQLSGRGVYALNETARLRRPSPATAGNPDRAGACTEPAPTERLF